MKTTAQIIRSLDKQSLINKLIDCEFSFAVWKMPQKREIFFVIDLGELEKTDSPLSTLKKGFLVNLFHDNHPVRPYHLHADILIEEEKIHIDPKVPENALVEFNGKMNAEPQKERTRSKEPIHFAHAREQYEKKVNETIDEVRKKRFEKVVLSRFSEMNVPQGFAEWNFFMDLTTHYPNNFCSMTHLPQQGLWMGASPELLLSDNDERFKTVALAGTQPLDNIHNPKEATWMHKDIEEQAMVSRYIVNCFKKIRLREYHEYGPKTIRSGNLAHLNTEFIVKKKEVHHAQLADKMLNLLHPTSAVCGMPIDKSKRWIIDKEQFDREFYSGFLGPVNFEKATNLYVNLRCIKIMNNCIRLYGGAGITEDSSPSKEFLETELKMDALRKIIDCSHSTSNDPTS